MEAIASGQEGVRERYRRLRAIQKRHASAATKRIAKPLLLDWCKRLGLLSHRMIVADSEAEVTLAFDLALYSARMGSVPLIRLYRKTVNAAPGSEEAALLDAMCDTRFCLLARLTPHPVAGLLATDMLMQEEVWLMDEALEQTGLSLGGVAARLIRAGGFHMTTGAVVPLTRWALLDVVAQFPRVVQGQHPELANHGKFIATVYRSSIDTGAMENVRYE